MKPKARRRNQAKQLREPLQGTKTRWLKFRGLALKHAFLLPFIPHQQSLSQCTQAARDKLSGKS